MTISSPIPPSKDPVEQDLREKWHEYKAQSESGSVDGTRNFYETHNRLAAYLWNRTMAIVEEDRRKHPKKKRNLPKSSGGSSGGRMLP